jgi:hypothetical protein
MIGRADLDFGSRAPVHATEWKEPTRMVLVRSSDKHGPVLDDEMKMETEGELRAGRSTRAEPWRDPEPLDDQDASDEMQDIARRRAEEKGRTRGGR